MHNPGKLLLDTSVIIEGSRNRESIISILEKADALYVPVIIYGELYLGAIKSKNHVSKLKELSVFIKACMLLDIDWRTAQHYANIRKHLEQKGKPIPENDLWISALAIQHGLTLFTKDHHFDSVEGLDLLMKRFLIELF